MTSKQIPFTDSQLIELSLDDVGRYEPFYNNDIVMQWCEARLRDQAEAHKESTVVEYNERVSSLLTELSSYLKEQLNHYNLRITDVLDVLDLVAERLMEDPYDFKENNELIEDSL